eukprot:TRINITY_DN10883_c0_g2_i15.p2 TRINITY_DN10883_c0_g2~~TRINITY_DN10883_c0_g2_i15.p2  ORF type:complete len:137 (+),score=13.18 TRINITY_DN10883_c0_g2_i15:209-619(+)
MLELKRDRRGPRPPAPDIGEAFGDGKVLLPKLWHRGKPGLRLGSLPLWLKSSLRRSAEDGLSAAGLPPVSRAVGRSLLLGMPSVAIVLASAQATSASKTRLLLPFSSTSAANRWNEAGSCGRIAPLRLSAPRSAAT